MTSLFDRAASFVNNWKEPLTDAGKDVSISVVVPAYQPSHLPEVIQHLAQIGGVDEVIVVDDSGDGEKKFFDGLGNNLDVLVVRHEKNLGLSAARNTGSVHATGDILVFIDSDMFLAPDFLSKVRATLASNGGHAVALGLRDTVPFADIPKISSWISPAPSRDWRRQTVVTEELIDLTATGVGSPRNRCHLEQTLRIYEESAQLRSLGVAPNYTLGFWDLPSIVIGHSMGIARDDFFKIGGFPEWIKGWGGEDIVFGFLAVAAGLPIVLTDAVSYHAQHAPFSGSESQKLVELTRNIARYREWAQSASHFPSCDRAGWLARGRLW